MCAIDFLSIVGYNGSEISESPNNLETGKEFLVYFRDFLKCVRR
jgi:hypothetical protein